jgi:predicted YcjX-like family ATPase
MASNCPIGLDHARDLCSAGTCDACKRDQQREAFAAMEQEQAEEYADYLRRCGGVPISHVKP